MNLIDALKTIEDNLRPGMGVECWMLDNGHMMRKVSFNGGDAFAATNGEWEAAIKANMVLSQLATTVDEFTDRYPHSVKMKGYPAEADHESPNVELSGPQAALSPEGPARTQG